MKESHHYGLPEEKRYMLKAINRLVIGSILIVWGGLLALKQAGIIEKNVSTWPFAFVAFGILLVIGGTYRLYARKKTANAEPNIRI